LKDARLHALRQPKTIDRTHHRGLRGLDRVKLVMRRGRGTGQIVDLVDVELEWVDHVVPHEFETRVSEQVLDVDFSASEKVVDRHDVMAISQQTIAQMRAEEPGAAGNENAHTGRD